MLWTLWVGLGALFAAIGVGLGAFGAHALKVRLSPEDLAIFEVGVRYQMYHALALIGVGAVAMRLESNLVKGAGWAFVIGILIFSGSLYALVATGTRILGAVTPIGGVAFIAGWLMLMIAAFKAHFS
ncbi:MAG TPA: DUF423 domain-containing protein [Oligoflexus sp.]|uniref:DUF423 domain-containing protein n=1 Tax=Oligoflexus sp. TaxID=1971216 RepID=UPI002D39D671|nr:DUF423 domain-containing protein [Oligoflexus sp.]HYX32475.1 DUF423 domain-containing protein [Oligoflexus sp.]